MGGNGTRWPSLGKGYTAVKLKQQGPELAWCAYTYLIRTSSIANVMIFLVSSFCLDPDKLESYKL